MKIDELCDILLTDDTKWVNTDGLKFVKEQESELSDIISNNIREGKTITANNDNTCANLITY